MENIENNSKKLMDKSIIKVFMGSLIALIITVISLLVVSIILT